MFDRYSGPWFTERNARQFARTNPDASVTQSTFDLDLHLERVRNPNKRTINALHEIQPSEYSAKRILSPLHPARGVDPSQNPFSPPDQIDTVFLLQLEDAYAGDNVVFDQDRYFSFDRIWAGDNADLYSQTETIEHVDAGVLVSGWGGSAFQLFMLDALPPLAAVIELLEAPGFEHLKIISHNRDAAFARWLWQTLGLLHRVTDKPINALERHVVHCDQLLFPHHSPSFGAKSIYPRNVLRPIQQRLGLLAGSKQDLIIYANRSNMNRSVKNQERFLEPLDALAAEFGLELVMNESKGNWNEDLALYRRAKIVIGPHGAGLANVAFAPPGTHVIEFIPIDGADFTLETTRQTAYYGISQAAGHHYWAIEPEIFDFHKHDMQVDAGEVVKLVEQLLSGTEEPSS